MSFFLLFFVADIFLAMEEIHKLTTAHTREWLAVDLL